MMNTLTIPQTSPLAAYEAQAKEISAAIEGVLRGGRYLLGPETEAFEREWAGYVGSEYAVTLASGTEALHLALRGCGVRPGDEVITVSHTAVATVSAIELAGATPVLVDIDPATYNLDPARLDAALTAQTRAVVLVHLYGRPGPVARVLAFCREHGLKFIEDCAQSHGALCRRRRVGSFGDAAAFSFYPTKNLGAVGDGGAAVTNDPQVAETMRSLRQYGWRKERYVSAEAGWNGRMDEIQAAILRVKLKTLDADNDRRRALAARYDERLAGIRGLTLPLADGAERRSVYHQYVVRCAQRGALAEHLQAAGVGTLVHYPMPIHRQPAYAARGLARGPMGATEQAAREVLSLPMYPQLSPRDADRAAGAVREFFGA